jgi:pimeloyl-ACP methyl ester carboxylesterase
MIPGLLCSARLYAQQVPVLWPHGPVTLAEHTRDDSMAGIARRILASAPPRFALVGLSMGGYIAFELLRQAPQRVARLALLDTTARADTPEATAARRTQMSLAGSGGFEQVIDALYTRMVHPARAEDVSLRELNRQMGREVGVTGYLNQQSAIIGRPDSRPMLAGIACPTLVLVGDSDQLTPPERAREMADAIRGARLVSVPRCGHLSTLEEPEAVNQALLGLLQG